MPRIGPFAHVLAAVALAAFSQAADAQGLDCTKAASAVEKAVCASPGLIDQDRSLAEAYAARLNREPASAAALRTEQRAWLAGRTKLCASKNEPPPRVTACLVGLYRTRLVALAAAGPATAAAPPPATPGTAPSPSGPAAQPLPAAPEPPRPSLPTAATQPAATLARMSVPASGATDVLVQVTSPGRFAIRAMSRTGVALQLVDMIAGPGDRQGEPGIKDGRVDALLDRGTYKLRAFGAPGATSEATLTVAPFREAAELSTSLVYGGEVGTELADLAQRSFWVDVPKPGRVFVEAVGRGLVDLKLWRNGRDLSELSTRLDRIAPRVGHAMTRARIEGDVEPGLYLATAYGGPPLAWADGDASLPLQVRAGLPESLAAGWVEGTIGPAGSARFEAPAASSSFRLDLPEPAPATLSVARVGGAPVTATIVKNSREPSVALQSGAGKPAIVEVTGLQGQPFRLRALDPSASRRVAGQGPHWIAIETAGEGGDEVPATVLLAQMDPKGARVLASSAPQIAPGKAWRQRFNLRGTTTILFEASAAMPVGLAFGGPKVTIALAPLLGARPPRADGRAALRYDLEAGWYSLSIEPVAGATGILDVTIGPPGILAEAPKPVPPRPSIALGIQALERGANYQVFTNAAPGLVLQPVARALPADLQTAPLAFYQAAGQALDIPVRAPAKGLLSARAVNGVPVPVALSNEVTVRNGRTATIRLPAPERPRGVVLSWSDPGAREPPTVAPPGDAQALATGRPHFLDLARNAGASFALDVPEGGLYRVETLGRLSTSLAVSTPFLPGLDRAAANGAGQNALSQTYLRAGRYAVAVKSADSSGRVGIVARPAPMTAGSLLQPGTSTRATLADGQGATFPIEIAEAGRYRLDLLSLGDPFRARLEDGEGWPLTAPGPTTEIDQDFAPGRYRLVVLPQPVDARVVVRLSPRVVAPEALAGHGPHPLPFDVAQAFQWREPAGAGDPRAPDRWEFALAGPADVTLALSDGMAGELTRVGETAPLARIVGKPGYSGRLAAGRYALEARSLGRNDRLDYRVSLAAKEIQPGAPRRVTLPATIPFAIGEDRVVSLTSFGRIDLAGVLKDGEGRVVERLAGRADDWNIGLSRRLPAGAYTLELAAIGPGPEKAKEGETSDADAATDDGPAEADDASTAPGDAAETADAPDTGPTTAADDEKADADDQGDMVEILFRLPESVDHPALAMSGEAAAQGGDVYRFPLPVTGKGDLLIAAARSDGELVLSLERGGPAGRWDVVGFARGTSPLVAAPADDYAARPWRLSAWTVDGGPARMQIAARSVHREPGGTGALTFDPVPFGAVASDVRVDRVAAPSSGVLAFRQAPNAVLAGSVAGTALRPADRMVVPQSDAVWLVTRGDSALAIDPAPPPAAATSLVVPEGGRATWPAGAPPAGQVRVWTASSTFGQPGLSAGRGTGIAAGSALALGGAEPVRIWNAGGTAPLAVAIASRDLPLAPEIRTSAEWSGNVAAGAAQPVRLPAGRKRLAVDLPAGTAAIADWTEPDAVTAWTGDTALSRRQDGDWTYILLVNLADAPRPVRLSMAPLGAEPEALAAGRVVKRFVGAAGSVRLPVAAAPGDRLVAVGAEAAFLGRDGRVARGRMLPLDGPGEVVLDHPPGLVAAWIERPGLSPWPDAAPVAAALPSSVTLAGAAMALALKPDAPILLHARTSGPAILSLAQGSEGGGPTAFPAGAELHRLLAPGDATLRLYSALDGPLSGSLDLTASPVAPAGEGIGEAVALAPGGTALFAFEVKRTGPVGIGIRSEPDAASARLLDASGRVLGMGIAQLHRLEPGRYVLEAAIPSDGRTTLVRPAIVGIDSPASGPPPDVVAGYLQLVGLAPTPPAR